MSTAASRTDSPKFLTVRKTTEVFSISKPTIYRLVSTGAIRMAKAGRRTLVEVASVEEYLRAHPVARRDAAGAY